MGYKKGEQIWLQGRKNVLQSDVFPRIFQVHFGFLLDILLVESQIQ